MGSGERETGVGKGRVGLEGGKALFVLLYGCLMMDGLCSDTMLALRISGHSLRVFFE